MSTATQAEFARMKNVSRKSITEWKRQGRLVMVGNLVDVEASQAQLLQSSGHRAVGRRAPVTPIGSSRSVTRDTFPDLPGPVLAMAAIALSIGVDVAFSILSHQDDETLARAVADEVSALALRGAIELVGEDFTPPGRYANWRMHPLFGGEPTHRAPLEWAELATEAAAVRAARAL